jgi:membrane complex biogenesis BtpA family protein
MKTLGLTKPLIGAVHLLPLPGAPRYRAPMRRIVDRALSDADALLSHGIDGLIVENFGDAPFFAGSAPPETIAAMTAVAHELRGLGSFPLGINVLRCDAEAAMAIAAAVGAQFIRANVLAGTMLTDQGPITGRAAQVLRLRESIKAKVVIWADLMVKHAAPLVPTDAVEAALDLRERSSSPAAAPGVRPIARCWRVFAMLCPGSPGSSAVGLPPRPWSVSGPWRMGSSSEPP